MDSTEMTSGGMVLLIRFIKIGKWFQEILRFYFSNLSGCNAGTPLR
jgi:hypothetical protein